MKKLTGTLSLLILLIAGTSFVLVSNKKIPPVCVNQEELKLFDMINVYRNENGLPPIRLSKSLTLVAQLHAKDLSINRPFSKKCNMHSWSNKGKWTSCCYTADHKQADCMWSKPKELTNYKGAGYEISHGYAQFDTFSGDTVTAVTSLEGWKNSKGHNDVILNKSIWKKTKWNSVGIGIYRDFSCVWFGKEADLEEIPTVCKGD